VIFADLVGFTEAARGLPPEEIVDFLDRPVRSFDALIAGRRLPASSAMGAKASGRHNCDLAEDQQQNP
jgi:class 3 adenylate cyclase